MTKPLTIHGLSFHYPKEQQPALDNVQLTIEAGERWLLTGANGAGKTTLLRLIAGKHMLDHDAISVLGRPAFHDTTLVNEVGFLGGNFPFTVDVRVGDILDRIQADPSRRHRLQQILGVNPDWHMHRISDGQRRRVQLFLGLVSPRQLLLLDEITTDLDLLCRADLLTFLRQESEDRRMSILYATHIFDRLESWATHLAFLHQGQLLLQARLPDLAGFTALKQRGVLSPLSYLVEGWLRDPATIARQETDTRGTTS